MRGLIVLRVGKDRPGTIRPECGAWRASDRSQEAVRVVIDSAADPGRIRWEFLPPETSVDDGPEEDSPRRFVPTGAMERASRLVQASGVMRETELVTLMEAKFHGTKRTTIKQAIALLVDGGYLDRDHGRLTHVNEYLQPGDPELDTQGIIPDVVDDSFGRATGQASMI